MIKPSNNRQCAYNYKPKSWPEMRSGFAVVLYCEKRRSDYGILCQLWCDNLSHVQHKTYSLTEWIRGPKGQNYN